MNDNILHMSIYIYIYIYVCVDYFYLPHLSTTQRFDVKNGVMFFLFVFTASTPLRKNTGVFKRFGRLYLCVLLD